MLYDVYSKGSRDELRLSVRRKGHLVAFDRMLVVIQG